MSAVPEKTDEDRERACVEVGADETMTERGRPDGNSDDKLDEKRESVACAGCGVAVVDADGDVDFDDRVAGGGDALSSLEEDIEGGEALPLRRGGSGTRDREGLGATLTLPPCSTLINLGLCMSEARASARASSVDIGAAMGAVWDIDDEIEG